jgi:hypothetical protein
MHSAAACREQGRVPAKQAVLREGRLKILDCIQHHLNNSLHISVSRYEPGNVQAQAPGNGRTDLPGVEDAFDFI